MISETLSTLVELINTYISPSSTDAPLVLANVARVNDGDDFSQGMQDKLILSIVNIEEDRVAKSPEHYVKAHNVVRYKNPAMHLNLTLLFAATHEYPNAIPLLERIIRFFQAKYVFTPANTPELAAIQTDTHNIEKVIFDWVNLNLEQVHQLWTTLGGHYMPSVVYKMRMITIDENTTQREGLPIKQVVGQYQRL